MPRRRPEGLEPPFPDRFTGDELQARIDGIRGNVASRLIDCSVCGGRMIENRHGWHLGCLGRASTQEPLEGPRIAGDWIDGPIGANGRQRAVDDAAAARAAEAAKAAMPAALAQLVQPTVVLEPDLDTQRRITKQLRAAPKCRICRKPMLTAPLGWSTAGDNGAHFICAEAERQGVPIDEIVALQPHGRVKGRKGRDLADVIWSTTVDETEKHWTDWAAAMAALEREDTE